MAAAPQRSVPYDRQVLLNCPFDNEYYPLLRAAVFTIHACEFTARIAFENTGSESVRLDRLVKMIRECRLGFMTWAACAVWRTKDRWADTARTIALNIGPVKEAHLMSHGYCAKICC